VGTSPQVVSRRSQSAACDVRAATVCSEVVDANATLLEASPTPLCGANADEWTDGSTIESAL
jgi:hypothetical protein